MSLGSKSCCPRGLTSSPVGWVYIYFRGIVEHLMKLSLGVEYYLLPTFCSSQYCFSHLYKTEPIGVDTNISRFRMYVMGLVDIG